MRAARASAGREASAWSWIEALGQAERTELRRRAEVRDLATSDMVCRPERTPTSVYLVEQGLVRIYRLSETGEEATIGYVGPGGIVGELAALDHRPRESFAQAVRPSRVWCVPADAFRRLLAERPALALGVARTVAERLQRIEGRVEQLVFRDVRTRVAQALCDLAEDFGRRGEDGVTLDIPLTQSELATLVGSTRQTVNLSLRQLEEEGLISRRERRIVLRGPQGVPGASEAAHG